MLILTKINFAQKNRRTLYTFNISKYILPSCKTYGCPRALQALTFVLRILASCFTAS